jgi:hypothetical protein
LITTRIKKFLKLSWADRFLFLDAFIRLGFTRAVLLLVPFNYIVPYLGRQTLDLPDDPDQSDRLPEWVERVVWAVETAARLTPWESACLAQAITGKFLLKQRGLETHLFLGMKKDAEGNLFAHAWLKAGNVILIGANGHETFTVLSVFMEK